MDASILHPPKHTLPGVFSAIQRNEPAMLQLLHLVFEFLSDADLVMASLVCQSWRSVALGCGRFGCSVALERAAAGAVADFIDRINCLSDHALDVQVHVPEGVLGPDLALNLLLAIQLLMPSIRSLELAFQAFPADVIVAGAVQRMLSAAAPHCHTLNLDAFHSALRVDIPSNLITGTCSLRRVTLVNVVLPDAGIPPSMRLVTEFELVSEQPVNVSELLAGMMQLTSLSLEAPSLRGLDLLPVQLETLKHVSLSIDSTADVDQLLQSAVLKLVPTVEVNIGCGPIYAALFWPLMRNNPGEVDIDLLIERNPGSASFRAAFTCADRGITRTLNNISLAIDDTEIIVTSGSIVPAELAAHLRMIVLPLDMLECIGSWLGNTFPELQSVVIDMYPPEVPYSGRWSAPRLETLALAGGPARLPTVSPLDVDFLRGCVFGSPEARVYCAGGIRVGKAPLLCRLEDFASFTHCFLPIA